MGAGLSAYLQADEAEALASFSSETPWPVDSDKWLSLFRFKFALWEAGPRLATDLGPYVTRLATNNAASNNLSTLAVIIATRLGKCWYFNGTDIDLTTSAVVSRGCRIEAGKQLG
jgi:hypothetical protein